MKGLITFLLLVTLSTAGLAQTSKVPADSVRNPERVVKNAPFSAEAISSSVQTLADGNKITRSSTSRIFRDNEGRFRREDMPKDIGVPGAVVGVPQSIFILDPVAGYRYELNVKQSTARQYMLRKPPVPMPKPEVKLFAKPSPPSATHGATATKSVTINGINMTDKDPRLAEWYAKMGQQRDEQSAKRAEQAIEREKQAAERAKQAEARRAESAKRAEEARTAKPVSSNSTTKKEALGIQNIEGVEAEGTRTTTTIAAGSIGNERDIEIVYETWYAKDLQLVVYSKHTDPRFGEQTYRLTNISRGEPSLDLFSPPANFTIVDGHNPHVKLPSLPKTSVKKTITTKPVDAKKAGN
jgi:hypothetical protein